MPLEQIEKRMKKNEESLRNLWKNIKQANMCIVGVPGGEKGRDREIETEAEFI